MSSKISLILIDPVDDVNTSTLERLSSEAKELSRWVPTLIISTPYGGKSSYYKTFYTSSCAPVDRSASRFFETISKLKYEHQQLLITFPEIGHSQILDSSEKFPFDGVCAQNSHLSRMFQRFSCYLIDGWIRTWHVSNRAETDENIMEGFISRVTDLNPSVTESGLHYTITRWTNRQYHYIFMLCKKSLRSICMTILKTLPEDDDSGEEWLCKYMKKRERLGSIGTSRIHNLNHIQQYHGRYQYQWDQHWHLRQLHLKSEQMVSDIVRRTMTATPILHPRNRIRHLRLVPRHRPSPYLRQTGLFSLLLAVLHMPADF